MDYMPFQVEYDDWLKVTFLSLTWIVQSLELWCHPSLPYMGVCSIVTAYVIVKWCTWAKLSTSPSNWWLSYLLLFVLLLHQNASSRSLVLVMVREPSWQHLFCILWTVLPMGQLCVCVCVCVRAHAHTDACSCAFACMVICKVYIVVASSLIGCAI